jgi:hypothetical protein
VCRRRNYGRLFTVGVVFRLKVKPRGTSDVCARIQARSRGAAIDPGTRARLQACSLVCHSSIAVYSSPRLLTHAHVFHRMTARASCFAVAAWCISPATAAGALQASHWWRWSQAAMSKFRATAGPTADATCYSMGQQCGTVVRQGGSHSALPLSARRSICQRWPWQYMPIWRHCDYSTKRAQTPP